MHADALNQAAADWPLPPASEEAPDPLLDCLIDLARLHGRAAERAGPAMIADDLLTAIPHVL